MKKHPEDNFDAAADVAETAAAEQDEATAALAAARDEAEANRDLYLRARADLDNFRKRAQREKEDLARFANEAILKEMIPVVDNLERALQHAPPANSDTSLTQGVEMTLSQLRKVLEKFGVTPIDAVGQPFDPAWHEAMGQVESADVAVNSVVQELQKGYRLNDRLLRPALVLIARAPAES